MKSLARFAWIVLAYNLGVIVWGAYVRASGSGAGCGSHWPLCNGEIVPVAASTATLIEYSHRLTSGLALIGVLALLIWTRRRCPVGHSARAGAWGAFIFILMEAAVGAGLVLFELVADNASMARAMFMAVHLVNTFILLGWLALTAWWLSGGERLHLAGRHLPAVGWALGCAGLLLVGSSGAVAALGDTLFPSSSLSEALHADLSTSSHLLIRLRVLHPVFAVAVALGLMAGAPRIARGVGGAAARLGRVVATLAVIQILIGFANVLLLAPIWLQLLHLLIADGIWIAFVLLGAAALPEPRAQTSSVQAA